LNFEASKAVNSLDSKQVNQQELLDKVDEFNRILNKHRLSNQESLVAYQSQLELRMDELNDLKHKIETSKKEIEQLKLNLIAQANVLNSNRLNALPAIESEINSKGMVDIDILFSANQGLTPVPIQKAASGGELSRVMLLLHQLISNKRTLPCILFDEIDTGVSGEVAEKIGILLNEMGKGRQLIAITHLPQVASKANYQLLVKKVEDSLPVETQLVKLSMKERIVEIARLMSGQEINDAAIINAQKLLGVNEA
jgi:DNA repair protein RecN (Recombination protein N)